MDPSPQAGSPRGSVHWCDIKSMGSVALATYGLKVPRHIIICHLEESLKHQILVSPCEGIT